MNAPSTGQRVQAIVALVAAAVLVVVVVVLLASSLMALLIGVIGLILMGAGGWWVVTEQMPRRGVGFAGVALGAVAVIVALIGVIVGFEGRVGAGVLVIVLAAIVLGETRLALYRGLHQRDVAVAPIPQHPVLIANRKSGGGKFDKFGLADIAADMGIEVVILTPGDDLEQLARDALARGADCLGMAGGDGSQALVAAVASENGVPFVCISAGTRNHFALDLGLDREDPRAGMVAFKEAEEHFIDYATVGDRLFVNNVSMGVYATIVQRDEYRDAKLETSKDLLPTLLGERNEPFDLQFRTPDGQDVDGAFLILVSNNPYVLGPKLDVSQRRSMTTGKLGVFAVNARTGADAATLLARSTLGLGARDPHIHQFEATEFVVDSHSGTAFAGVDGEALELPTPLDFKIHPGGLRIRLPLDSEERLARRRSRDVSMRDLLRVAAGRPMKS